MNRLKKTRIIVDINAYIVKVFPLSHAFAPMRFVREFSVKIVPRKPLKNQKMASGNALQSVLASIMEKQEET